tara:strand:- start:84 stop:413 length:330 start_codon:yes stop_codon:yes gene_type:complete
MSDMTNKSTIRTEPATEENLSLENDIHPFDSNPHRKLSKRHPVIVDGIVGEACIGCLGGYSTRINIELNEEHPELGREFQTKYFRFIEPGFVEWGHYGQNFNIEKVVKN